MTKAVKQTQMNLSLDTIQYHIYTIAFTSYHYWECTMNHCFLGFSEWLFDPFPSSIVCIGVAASLFRCSKITPRIIVSHIYLFPWQLFLVLRNFVGVSSDRINAISFSLHPSSQNRSMWLWLNYFPCKSSWEVCSKSPLVGTSGMRANCHVALPKIVFNILCAFSWICHILFDSLHHCLVM